MDNLVVETSPAEQRSGEILDRIKSVFSAKGFDGASMQDLAHAAGMSAGNFYRYFPSKNAIIEALAQRNLEKMEGDFAVVRRSEDPRKAFRDLLQERVATIACEDAPIWAEINAASFRKPEIAALKLRMENQVADNIAATLAQISGMPSGAELGGLKSHARFIILLVQSLSCVNRSGPAQGGLDPELYALVLDTIEDIVRKLPQATPAPAGQESH